MELPFFYYSSNVFVFVLEVIFYLNIPTLLIIFLLTAMLNIESIPFFAKRLRDNKNKSILGRIYLFRVFGTIVLLLPGFFDFNEYFILILSGSFLGPIIMLILPVSSPDFCLLCLFCRRILSSVQSGLLDGPGSAFWLYYFQHSQNNSV